MPIDATRPSSSKKTAAELEAELAAMEVEEAAEARRRQEREEKKKKIAELAEAKKAEEAAAAVAAAAEAARKAARKAAKRRAETQEENVEAPAAKKQKATDEVDGGEELAREACRRCNLQKVDCVRAAGSRGKTCKSCLKIKQKCEAVWGELAAGYNGLPAISDEAMKLFERLVVGVERMGAELELANARLENIERVLWEGAIDESEEIVDQGLSHQWFDSWKDSEIDEELKELEEENEVFLEFLQTREEEESEEEDENGIGEGEVA